MRGTVNLMVNQIPGPLDRQTLDPVALDRIFAALADPTRRSLITRLHGTEGSTVSALAAPLPMSLPAVLKHLEVLEGAGLIARQKTGRSVHIRLTPEPMQAAADWLERHRRFWGESLDRLADLVEGGEA